MQIENNLAREIGRPLPGIAYLSQAEKEMKQKQTGEKDKLVPEAPEDNDITNPDYRHNLAVSKAEEIFIKAGEGDGGKKALVERKEEIRKQLIQIEAEYKKTSGGDYEKMTAQYNDLEDELRAIEELINTKMEEKDRIAMRMDTLQKELKEIDSFAENPTGLHQDVILALNKEKKEIVVAELLVERIKLAIQETKKQFNIDVSASEETMAKMLAEIEKEKEVKLNTLREEIVVFQKHVDSLVSNPVRKEIVEEDARELKNDNIMSMKSEKDGSGGDDKDVVKQESKLENPFKYHDKVRIKFAGKIEENWIYIAQASHGERITVAQIDNNGKKIPHSEKTVPLSQLINWQNEAIVTKQKSKKVEEDRIKIENNFTQRPVQVRW